MGLLALLAGTPLRVLARDKIVGMLWPETDAPTARQLLNVSVHELRRALGNGVLLSEGDTLRLDVARIRVDAIEFEAALASADSQHAIELYTGPFLDGFALPDAVEFEQWADVERDRLERRYQSALQRLAERALSAGDVTQSVVWWRLRLARTPADGRVARCLMEALEAAGDRAGALKVAKAHAALLEEEFGAHADPDVVGLAHRLRRRAASAEHSPMDAAAANDVPNPSDHGSAFGEMDETQLQSESAATVGIQPGSVPRLKNAAFAVVGIAAIAGIGWYGYRQARVQWAREVALVEATGLIEQGSNYQAFEWLRKAEKFIRGDPSLHALLEESTLQVDVTTVPAEADVYVRDFFDASAPWEYLGRSPLKNVRLPAAPIVWQVSSPGFETKELLRWGRRREVNFSLQPAYEAVPGTVHVPAGSYQPFDPARPFFTRDAPPVQVGDYRIDKYEVTNREFKTFIDDGGYVQPEHWREALSAPGSELSWDRAQQLFRDATGQLGPATWIAGSFPDGQDDAPVGGVSWYEAAAYCTAMKRRLPTVHHWLFAADMTAASQYARFGNFSGKGPEAVGQHTRISPSGAHDMAGNVKEWVWNLADAGRRYLLGGAWPEPTYAFQHPDALAAVERHPTHGFRCAVYGEPLTHTLAQPVPPTTAPKLREPVSDDQFNVYRSLYSYDPAPLDSRVEWTDERADSWRVERVSFAAAYGGERVPAVLFLPTRQTPPYQTVLYSPGAGAFAGKFEMGSAEGQREWFLFLVRSGRAVVVPMYKGTFERFTGPINRPHAFRDFAIAHVKDLSRTIDYLETRPDIDREKLAYFGLSNGATMGPIVTAVEHRLRASILIAGGLAPVFRLGEVDPINFASRVKLPTLMINGRYDFTFAYETSQLPLFERLGTPEADKYHEAFPSGHVPSEWNEVIRMSVAWLDRYLGSVGPSSNTSSRIQPGPAR